MGQKSPNHRFSLRRERTVSRTQSAIDNAFAFITAHSRRATLRDDMSRRGKAPSENETQPRSPDGPAYQEKDYRETTHSIRRVLAIFKSLNDPIFQRDLANIEGAMGPGLDRDAHIERLGEALATLSQVESDKIRKLTEKNEELEAQHHKLEKTRKELENKQNGLNQKHQQLETEHASTVKQMAKEDKRRTLELEQKLAEKAAAEKDASKVRLEKMKKEVREKMDTEMGRIRSENHSLKEKLAAMKEEHGSEVEMHRRAGKQCNAEITDLKAKLSVVDPSRSMSRNHVDF
ncbi:hypothetical protein LOZ66_006815 [Ophidiomyces ophidiicola]|nr:hypothetical protein LOZ66_006815 [Ophidiomyces ophidiicola]